MRHLVTGGAGFVGSHLVERLLTNGDEVVVVDDFSTGQMANLVAHQDNAQLTVIEHDVVQPFSDWGVFDQIWNLACPASPPRFQQAPIQTLRTSVEGTLHGLQMAHAQGARFLQASTSEVYGDPLVSPQPEAYWGNVNPIGVRACYDEGKTCRRSAVL